MNALQQFPSYINQELTIPPPGAIDHLHDIDNDGDNDDDGDSRYELWTVRIPSDVNVSDLDGVEFDLEAITERKTGAGGMKIQEGKFVIDRGETVEHETFRVLVPSGDDDSSSSSSDDDDLQSDTNQTKNFLHPSSKGFSRHFNIHKNLLSRKSETELAPAKGPDPVGDTLRHAYCPIPQRKGLKRRWMPLGNPQTAKDIPSKLVTVRHEGGTETQTARTVVLASDDEKVVHRPKKRSSSKRRRSGNGTPNGNPNDTPKTEEIRGGSGRLSSPQTKRIIKDENNNNNKNNNSNNATTPTTPTKAEKKAAKKKAAKKAAKKQRKSFKKEKGDALSV